MDIPLPLTKLPAHKPQAHIATAAGECQLLSRPGRKEAPQKRQTVLEGENIQMKHLELPLAVVSSPTPSAWTFLALRCGCDWL